jgi:3-hydroxyisobutyrate dehydrogenase-like beta-hydroxyacid dehydrogenase
LQWGIIGFGEAGSSFAAHIGHSLSRPIQVVDPLLNRLPLLDHMRARLDRVTVEIVADTARLVSGCDIVLSLVTPGVASLAAEEAASAWSKGLYIDFNSITPKEKQRLAARFPADSYIDGAILGSIAGEGSAAPLALSGPRASEAQACLSAIAFTASAVGTEVGAASALKMCRSIFMKGLECLFVESLVAADGFNVTEPVLSSIEETIMSYGVRPLAKMLVTTHAAHCERRSEEMEGVTRMLEETGISGRMSQTARDFLAASFQSGVTNHFDRRVPDQMNEVITFFRSHSNGEKQ